MQSNTGKCVLFFSAWSRLAFLGFYTSKCMSFTFPRMNTWRVYLVCRVSRCHSQILHCPCFRNKYYSSRHRDWLRSCMASFLTLNCLAAVKVLRCFADCAKSCSSVAVFLFLSLFLAAVCPVVLPVFGLYSCTDVASCAVYLHCREMMRSSYVAIIFRTRPSNVLHLARVSDTTTHTEPHRATDTVWHYATLFQVFNVSETDSLCILVHWYNMDWLIYRH